MSTLIEVAAGVVTDSQGRVLICCRMGEMNGLWEFPGGKREAGETIQQCLERELMEELSLPVKAGDVLATVTRQDKERCIRLLFVSAQLQNEAEIALRVHSGAEWIRADEMSQFTFCPADETFINQFFRQNK